MPHNRKAKFYAWAISSMVGAISVEVDCLSDKANATRPEIEQILISNSKGVDEETFERELYVIRRRIEKAAAAAGINGLYLASLSCVPSSIKE